MPWLIHIFEEGIVERLSLQYMKILHNTGHKEPNEYGGGNQGRLQGFAAETGGWSESGVSPMWSVSWCTMVQRCKTEFRAV